MQDRAQEAFETLFGPEFGHGKSFHLKRLHEALAALGDPQEKLPPVFHVAGTNGKGSTIAFLRALAEASHLKVHAFTKPHMLHLRERFGFEDDAIIASAKRVASVSGALTQFEAQVACAFLLFCETPADLVLIETGMGGRDDATNVLAAPSLTLITPIGLDHQDALGPALEEIAAHKAGILKPGVLGVIARQDPRAMAVIEARADEIGAPLFRQGIEWDAYPQMGRLIVQTEDRLFDLPPPSLAGAHQFGNAGLAVAAFEAWRTLTDDAAARAIGHTVWPGRLQRLTAETRCELWFDAGHNLHAAEALARALNDMNAKRPARTALIIGLRARKDWRSFVDTLAAAASQVIAIPLGADGAPPQNIASAAGDKGSVAASVDDALQHALGAGAERVLICGSFLLAREVLL